VFSSRSVSFSAPSQRKGFRYVQQTLFQRETFVISWMRHQELRTDDDGALHFAGQRIDGPGPDLRVSGGEIDEVVVVNYQGCQIVGIALGLKQPNLLDNGWFCPPHTRAGGKDLERIRAQFRRFFSGALQRARRRAVDSDSQYSSIRVLGFGSRAGCFACCCTRAKLELGVGENRLKGPECPT
jgi:hypothetical protein